MMSPMRVNILPRPLTCSVNFIYAPYEPATVDVCSRPLSLSTHPPRCRAEPAYISKSCTLCQLLSTTHSPCADSQARESPTRASKNAFRTGDSYGVPHCGVPPLRLAGRQERHPQPTRAPFADGERAVQLFKVPEGPGCRGQDHEGPGHQRRRPGGL